MVPRRLRNALGDAAYRALCRASDQAVAYGTLTRHAFALSASKSKHTATTCGATYALAVAIALQAGVLLTGCSGAGQPAAEEEGGVARTGSRATSDWQIRLGALPFGISRPAVEHRIASAQGNREPLAVLTLNSARYVLYGLDPDTCFYVVYSPPESLWGSEVVARASARRPSSQLICLVGSEVRADE